MSSSADLGYKHGHIVSFSSEGVEQSLLLKQTPQFSFISCSSNSPNEMFLGGDQHSSTESSRDPRLITLSFLDNAATHLLYEKWFP